MDDWGRDDIWRASEVCVVDGQAWLVVFDLARIDGRVSCVGMSIRSWLGSDDADEDALRADAFSRGVRPMPLRATTLRKIPFADTLVRARRREADSLRRLLTLLQESPDLDDPQVDLRIESPGVDEWVKAQLRLIKPPIPPAEAVNRYASVLGESGIPATYGGAADALSPSRRGVGRPPKYTTADLQRVARIWTEADDAGVVSPIKAVMNASGLSRSQVSKLVRRCRQEGLLPTVPQVPPAAPDD